MTAERPSIARHDPPWVSIAAAGLLCLSSAAVPGGLPQVSLAVAGEVERVTITGGTDVRWLQVDVDDRAPSGLFGESLEQGTTLLRRALVEITGAVNDNVTAGALLRLSNEPDAVLRLGPDFYGRPEGSAFASLRTRCARARVGYFPVHFTPLTLMRWDRDDLGLGGVQRGCGVCGGTASAVLIESLEEIRPELTFEGARLDGEIQDWIDWTAFYARPKPATRDEIPGLSGIFDPETFQYHQDLYGLRAVFSRLHLPTLTSRQIGVSVLHARDDPFNPFCPTGDPLCHLFPAAQVTGAGLDLRCPVGKRILMEGEWLRTAARHDTRGGSSDSLRATRWANGIRATAALSIIPNHVRVTSAYLRLEESFESPYGALTYAPNRAGHRHRVDVEVPPISIAVFVRRLVALGRECLENCAAELDATTTLSGQAGARIAKGVEASIGLRRDRDDIEAPAGGGGRLQDTVRDIFEVDASAERQGFRVALVQQWIRERDFRPERKDGKATVTSLTATVRF
jgi:hypothetical protein